MKRYPEVESMQHTLLQLCDFFSVLFISQKSQTPKSESKKVTFGLKNNKTAGKKLNVI